MTFSSPMTPLEKCAAVCAVLARYDRPEGVAIASEEIARYEKSFSRDDYQRARALEALAFKLAIDSEPTAFAAELDRTIAARIRALGASAV